MRCDYYPPGQPAHFLRLGPFLLYPEVPFKNIGLPKIEANVIIGAIVVPLDMTPSAAANC